MLVGTKKIHRELIYAHMLYCTLHVSNVNKLIATTAGLIYTNPAPCSLRRGRIEASEFELFKGIVLGLYMGVWALGRTL